MYSLFKNCLLVLVLVNLLNTVLNFKIDSTKLNRSTFKNENVIDLDTDSLEDDPFASTITVDQKIKLCERNFNEFDYNSLPDDDKSLLQTSSQMNKCRVDCVIYPKGVKTCRQILTVYFKDGKTECDSGRVCTSTGTCKALYRSSSPASTSLPTKPPPTVPNTSPTATSTTPSTTPPTTPSTTPPTTPPSTTPPTTPPSTTPPTTPPSTTPPTTPSTTPPTTPPSTTQPTTQPTTPPTTPSTTPPTTPSTTPPTTPSTTLPTTQPTTSQPSTPSTPPSTPKPTSASVSTSSQTLSPEVSTTRRTVMTSTPFVCPAAKYYRDPTDPKCQRFYRCFNVDGLLARAAYVCPNETIFDESISNCQFPYESNQPCPDTHVLFLAN